VSDQYGPGELPIGESAEVRVGSRVAGYRVESQVGRGGMAVVFRGRDERLGRTVALKVLAPALAADEAFRQRFIRESRAAAAVDDPHIIPVYEAGDADGVLFIAMRFVSGGDLRTLVRGTGPLSARRATGIASPVASALDAAHEAGLVHRDVKPSNMLLDTRPGRPDHVYLSDFGLSKGALSSVGLTGSGLFLGTPDYISPEQIAGRPADGRADQYALACSVFELLCGEPPFSRDHGMAVIYAHLNEPPPTLTSRRPDLPAAVDEVLARAMAKEPADRYPSCGDFADALRLALDIPAYEGEPRSGEDQRPATVIVAATPTAEAIDDAPADRAARSNSASTLTSPSPSPAGTADMSGEDTAGTDAADGTRQPIPAAPLPLPSRRSAAGGTSLIGPAPGAGAARTQESPKLADLTSGRTSGGGRRAAMATVATLALIAAAAGILLPRLSHGSAPTQHSDTRGHGKKVKPPPIISIAGRINAVTAAPGGTAWAVGQSCPSFCDFAPTTAKAMILRWNGTNWLRVPAPSPGMDANLTGVSAAPDGTAWAVGQYCATSCAKSNSSTIGTAFILRWDGSAWSRVPSPAPGSQSYLSDVSVAPDGTAWAVGSCECIPSQVYSGMILRWNGSTWLRVPSPNPGTFDGLTAVGQAPDGTAWAVGTTCPLGNCANRSGQTLVVRWDGTAWSQVPSPSPGANAYLGGLAVSQDGTAWAIGQSCKSYCLPPKDRPIMLFLHWNGSAWMRSPVPVTGYISGVSAGSGGTAWAAGQMCIGNCSTLTSVILRWTGAAWSRIPIPRPPPDNWLDTVLTAKNGTAWAFGEFCTAQCQTQSQTSDILILRWNGTTWSRW